MENMTKFQKEEFEKVCKEMNIDDIKLEDIEKLLEIQRKSEIDGQTASQKYVLEQMAEVILGDD
jgi:uncharacterized protein YprB with RNaseH-like and TPR domain